MATTNAIPSLYILADDITGAADCAARCKQAGLPATILIEMANEVLPEGAVALSSDSRHLPPSQAAACVQQAYRMLQDKAQGVARLCYKKIDSTLRGNIGAELAGLLSVAPLPTASAIQRPCAVVSPAFPAQGRGLVDGYLVYDQATAQTAHLPSLIQQQTNLPLATVALPVVRAGVAHLAQALADCYQQGAQIVVVDATSEADLAQIYQATRQALPHALFCGSAGLIGVIATALVAEQADVLLSVKPPTYQVEQPLLAVVGSGSVMAHRQLAHLRQHTQVRLYEIDPQQPADTHSIGGEASSMQLALHLSPPAVDVSLEGALARQSVAVLSAVALQQIQQQRPRTLLLVGGDTAIHLLKLLGIHALHVQWEVQPGMPVTLGRASDGQLYQIILKAGNHGDEQTLVTLFG